MNENISPPSRKGCAVPVRPGPGSRAGARVTVARLYACPVHVYVGHFGRPPGITPMRESTRLELVSGRGIVGDRYFDYPPGHKGQVTFFAEESWERLCREFGVFDLGPGVFRRNVITRDTDLLSLVGEEFEVQGVRFVGSEYCKPCAWMDSAFAAGAYAALAAWRSGGLRARVLSDGHLRCA